MSAEHFHKNPHREKLQKPLPSVDKEKKRERVPRTIGRALHVRFLELSRMAGKPDSELKVVDRGEVTIKGYTKGRPKDIPGTRQILNANGLPIATRNIGGDAEKHENSMTIADPNNPLDGTLVQTEDTPDGTLVIVESQRGGNTISFFEHETRYLPHPQRRDVRETFERTGIRIPRTLQ